MKVFILSYDIAVIQWITSCHKNRITTRLIIITLWCEHVSSLTTSSSTMSFLSEIMFILKAIKIHFKESYDKQNLILVVISYSLGAESRKKSYAKHFGYKLATGLHLKKIKF